MCVQFAKAGSGVAPLVGAWIEIYPFCLLSEKYPVAPLVGAWIEISSKDIETFSQSVAPLVGAWIEICNIIVYFYRHICRSSCRSVD